MEIDVRETIAQLGGLGLYGAPVYIGAIGKGAISYHKDTVYLKVNGKRGYKSYISIKLEPMDWYTVQYFTIRKYEKQILKTRKEVYCDELKEVVEKMYDDTLLETNNGLIPMG